MGEEMFYLLRAIREPDFTQLSEGVSEGGELGLYRIRDGEPEPVVKPKNSGALGFEKPEDLGVAIARFFRTGKKGIDAIAVTERIELNRIPLFPDFLDPRYVSWREPVVLYTGLNGEEYMALILAMTKELGGKTV